MILFFAELNRLKIWCADVGNTYLEACTQEKVYIIAGADFSFVGLEGHTLVINKALYGLKTSRLVGTNGSPTHSKIWNSFRPRLNQISGFETRETIKST